MLQALKEIMDRYPLYNLESNDAAIELFEKTYAETQPIMVDARIDIRSKVSTDILREFWSVDKFKGDPDPLNKAFFEKLKQSI